jgi:hypothetical protein
MARELTVHLFVGDEPIETLTEAQREKITQRLTERMSVYYTAHPLEYLSLIKGEAQ